MTDNNPFYGKGTFKGPIPAVSSRPPTVSAAVWTQLLRGVRPTKDGSQTSQPDISHLAPPLAPLDKNASSMRVLLHDTQANFERFTVEVESLFKSVSETKSEIKTVSSLFTKDREALISDMIDLVNRSQREILKSIGEPAQTSFVESSLKEVNGVLNHISKRLDSIESFNDTHSRALQTQMQSIHLLLENQGKIVTAVTPLLPLLQALPPHIETLRASITDSVEKTVWKGLCTVPTSPSPQSSRKRRRSSAGTSRHTPSHLYSHSDDHTSEYQQGSIKRPRISDDTASATGPQQDHHRERISPYGTAGMRPADVHQNGTQSSISIREENDNITFNGNKTRTEFSTPRRPLFNVPGSLHRLPPPMMRKASVTSTTGNMHPPPTQPDHSLRRLASAAHTTSDPEIMPPPDVARPSFFSSKEKTQRPTLSDILKAETQSTSRQGVTSNSGTVHPTPEARQGKAQSIVFPSPGFFANGLGESPAHMSTPRPGSSHGLDVRDRQTILPSSTPKFSRPLKPLGSLPFGQTNLEQAPSPRTQSSIKTMRASGSSSLTRGRQSLQQVEGRRFIPLDDSDDEIEDDTGE